MVKRKVEDELEICRKRSDNVSIDVIMTEYNISRATVYRILNKHLETPCNVGKKITKDQVIEIINMWNAHESQIVIANKFAITQTMVSQIINRKTRTSITEKLWIRDHTPKDICKVNVIYNL